jgi:zinc/manganese transport system substrate-binding protein
MKKFSTFILMLVLALCFNVSLFADGKRLNVIATTADFGAIAREIGGDAVQLTVLAQPGEDAHFVTPKPSYIAKLARTDLLIEGGAELEVGWLPPLIEGSRNPRLTLGRPAHVACAEGLSLLEVPSIHDRAQGDIHAMGNPHYMTDPANARRVAERIGNALATADPANADQYHVRLTGFKKRLDDKMAKWAKQLEPFRETRVVAYHNSWPYFARRFNLAIDLFLEPQPGIPPSPSHLANVIVTMKTQGIRIIIVEPHQNRKTAETVAAKTGATLLDFSQYPGGIQGTEAGYIEFMDYLVNTLENALTKGRAQ